MRPADIPFGMELKKAAGWNQTEADWRAILGFNPDGCFIAEWDGEPAGSATTTIHDGKVAWIGMVLVLPAFRGRGLGTALLKHAIAHLQSRGIPSIKLDATPAGKRVYVPLGFRDEYALERVEGIADRGSQISNLKSQISNCRVEDILALDREAFGVSREPVLRRLVRENASLCWQARDGFLLARPGANAWLIGPWVARNADAAEALLQTALDRLAGQRVFADVPVNHPARALVARHGFTTQRPLTRMWLGCNDWPGNTALTWSIADLAKG
jgi:GNAT superfamily N-acetyltransferase